MLRAGKVKRAPQLRSLMNESCAQAQPVLKGNSENEVACGRTELTIPHPVYALLGFAVPPRSKYSVAKIRIH